MATHIKDERKFSAAIEIIGINPFVTVPEEILAAIFEQSGKSKGPIAIRGTVNGRPYQQTLVRYKGAWRLYINTIMLKDSPKRFFIYSALLCEQGSILCARRGVN